MSRNFGAERAPEFTKSRFPSPESKKIVDN